jgi:hypothetical protein
MEAFMRRSWLRALIVSTLALGLGALQSGCLDSCSELCSEQASFINSCLEDWGLSWDDITDAEGQAYGTQSAYGSACRKERADAIAGAIETCAPIEDDEERRRCESTFRLDILDTCEGDKIKFRFSCATYFEENVDPGLTLPGDDDDSAP